MRLWFVDTRTGYAAPSAAHDVARMKLSGGDSGSAVKALPPTGNGRWWGYATDAEDAMEQARAAQP